MNESIHKNKLASAIKRIITMDSSFLSLFRMQNVKKKGTIIFNSMHTNLHYSE